MSQVLEGHAYDADAQQRVDDAVSSGAYRSALIVAGETIAAKQATDAWDDAQREPDPAEAFVETMAARVQAQLATLRAVADDFANRTQGSSTAAEVEALVVTAHVLVWAEQSNYEAASYLTGAVRRGTEGGSLSHPVQRYTIVRPIVLADLYVEVMAALLPTVPAGTGAAVDTRVIEQVVAANGGTPGDWRIPEAGILHRLARHVNAGEEAMGSLQAATTHDVEDAISHIPGVLDDAHQAGLSGTRLAMVGLDAAWWLGEEAKQGGGPTWGPLLRGLNASVEGAIYEAKLLQQALEEDDGWPPWLIAAGAGAAVALISGTVVFILRKQRWRRRAGAARPATQHRMAWAFLCTVLMMAPTVVSATDSLADPHTEPVPVLESLEAVGNTHMAINPDDEVYFVWTECTGVIREGCVDIQYRSYDPGANAWSPASTLIDSQINASFPQLYWTGDQVQLLWTEGGTYYDGEPVVLKWCALEHMACSGTPTILSDPDLQVFVPRGVVGPDGMLRVAWQSEYHYEDQARVVLREQRSGGWGPEVFFDTGSVLQRAPAVAVDGDGRAHVAWREMDPEEALGNIQQWFTYATVESGAVQSSEPVRLADSPMYRREVSLAVGDGMVHALYSLETDVYHRERDAADADAEWSVPVNVSRVHKRTAGQDQILLADGDKLTAFWIRGTVDHFQWMAAQRVGGVWGQPRELVGAPFNRILEAPQAVQDSQGATHALWKGVKNGEPYKNSYPYYRIFGGNGSLAYVPPEILSFTPGHETWVRSDPVTLVARVATDSGVDRDATRLSVDGTPVSYTIDPEGALVADAVGLAEGLHEVMLEFHDHAGGSITDTSWFRVDRTPPLLSYTVSDGATTGIAGWQMSRVTVEAHADALGGAPAKTQFDVDESGIWNDFSGSSNLLEGRLFNLRFRAIDEAGNVDLGPVFKVGWDATPPTVRAETSAFSMNGHVVVQVHAKPPEQNDVTSAASHDHHDGHHHDHSGTGDNPPVAGPGSPIHVQVMLHPSGGGDPISHVSPLDEGRLVLEDVPAGTYRLSSHATDEAGNTAAAEVANETITVDRDPPMLQVTTRGDGSLVLRATDDVSGVRLVRVEAGGSVLLEETADGVGELEVVAPAVPVEASVRVEDVAGHVGTWRLHPGGILEDADPVQAGGPPEDIHGPPPGDERIPAPLPWIAILVALPPARRLCRG